MGEQHWAFRLLAATFSGKHQWIGPALRFNPLLTCKQQPWLWPFTLRTPEGAQATCHTRSVCPSRHCTSSRLPISSV